MNNLTIKRNDGVLIIELNRAPVNALSFNYLKEIKSEFLKAEKDNNIHIIIMRSNLKHFSAGADLKERSIMNSKESQKALDNFNDCFNIIENSNKITICAINGYCLGGGAEMALSFDIRLASEDAIIGFPEVSIGIIPGAGGTQRLQKIIGYSNSKYWIYTAKKFNSLESKEYGFINFISKNKIELFKESESIANKILGNAPIALKSAKKAINDGYYMNIVNGLKSERNNYNVSVNTDDREEALDAFINKRKPKWRNR